MKQSREKRTEAAVAEERTMRGSQTKAGLSRELASHREQTKPIAKEGEQTMEATKGFIGFEPKNVTEGFLKMVKYSVETAFDGIAKVQEFNDKRVKDAMTVSKQIQADAEKIVAEWVENGRKGWDEYRKIVEKGVKQTEDLLQPTK